MPLRVCSVGFKAATGISHFVEVEAETLYEAAALGLARLKADGWVEGLGPGTARDRGPRAAHTSLVDGVAAAKVDQRHGQLAGRNAEALTPAAPAAREAVTMIS